MFEWQKVQPVNFTNYLGIKTSVKMRHEFKTESSTREVDVDGRDMDQIAFDELGTELESLRITELNAVVLIENDYDMTNIRKIRVPIG